jgi:hypothetical protein
MSQQVNNSLRRSSRIRFTPVFLAEEQSQEVTFTALQSTSSTTTSLLSRMGSESRCTSRYAGLTLFQRQQQKKMQFSFSPFTLLILCNSSFFCILSSTNIELSSFHREKKRTRQASPKKKKSANTPLKLKNGVMIASKSRENTGDKPCSQWCLAGDKNFQQLQPQAMHTSALGCACNGFVRGNFSISTKGGEKTNSSLYSLILQPKNAAPCYNLKSKIARVSDLSEVHHGANGITTSDPQIIPKQAFSHPAPSEDFIESLVCSR